MWRKWALCKLVFECVWVRGRVAGTIQLPAGQCPVTDPSVSTLIRQRQATASWTPCAPMHIQTHSNGSKVDYLSYVYTNPDSFENASLSLAFCPHWDCVFVLRKLSFFKTLSQLDKFRIVVWTVKYFFKKTAFSHVTHIVLIDNYVYTSMCFQRWQKIYLQFLSCSKTWGQLRLDHT